MNKNAELQSERLLSEEPGTPERSIRGARRLRGGTGRGLRLNIGAAVGGGQQYAAVHGQGGGAAAAEDAAWETRRAGAAMILWGRVLGGNRFLLK